MKKIILIIGPESTGTRIFTEILSNHPMITGTSNASEHHDILDEVWQELEKGKIRKARQVFSKYKNDSYILTRRSMPHAHQVGQAAHFMDFANLWNLHKLCLRTQFDLVLLITTRSTVPHLSAWTLTRASSKDSLEKAMAQYHAAYCHLFQFINQSKRQFFFLSLEALVLDHQEYVQSLFELLDLPQYSIDFQIKPKVNEKRYQWYSENFIEKNKF